MSRPSSESAEPDRYDRQTRYAPLGEKGQRQIARRRALVCGCGALGSLIANLLVRAGVGAVRLVDRDLVEATNLHRVALFDEQDVADQLPKAVAAAAKLRRVNSAVEIEPIVADVSFRNVESLCDGVDVILDGTDNFETRFLINDAAVRLGMPWVYGGCLGAEGQTMTILPGETACLRCLMRDCPPPGTVPTCDVAGILGPAVSLVASFEVAEALKILSGNRAAVSRHLTVVDLWANRVRQIDVARLRDQADCPACRRGEFPWLDGRRGSQTAVLCGRHAVQLSPTGGEVALDDLARRLETVGRVTLTPFLLRLSVDRYDLTLFADGRAIVAGTTDEATARAVYAKYVGH